MRISAIVSEYNPLHAGHKYHIEKTKEITQCDAVICIMSGNFVQRGEPAIIDKWHRAEMSLNEGIDLVIELPCIYSLASAELFAMGAIKILNKLSVVNYLCFGSESGNVNKLKKIAYILHSEPEEFKVNLKKNLSYGMSFPSAREKSLFHYLSNNENLIDDDLSNVLKSSNNILGIEYCKSLIRSSSNITPYTIERIGSDYNSEEIQKTFSSATAIRKYIKNKNVKEVEPYLTKVSLNMIRELINKDYDFAFSEKIFDFIKYKMLTEKYPTIKNLPDCSEGLDNRIYSSLVNSASLAELINNTKTKRYTYTRISRLLHQYFIGFETFDIQKIINSDIDYIRVLGLNTKGAEILKKLKQNTNINIINKVPKNILSPMLNLDILSTKAYSVVNNSIKYNEDYLKSPIIY
ncbi:nucleotidyltransferase [Clostridium sp. 19966]|uniref:nucleotidyltransferase n=1 Tax=Clostridium sp. 19966 TaxID=2768166 RepID=UPI0028E02EB2|nr:nucleotidyltransferase [Clostridium sp. 19966]MDT8716459.1 nucleotidyltransferase [Clostridium sp. 19966]